MTPLLRNMLISGPLPSECRDWILLIPTASLVPHSPPPSIMKSLLPERIPTFAQPGISRPWPIELTMCESDVTTFGRLSRPCNSFNVRWDFSTALPTAILVAHACISSHQQSSLTHPSWAFFQQGSAPNLASLRNWKRERASCHSSRFNHRPCLAIRKTLGHLVPAFKRTPRVPIPLTIHGLPRS